ncbi:hypothetical protein [Microbaculum marinum]|uniref:Asparagine synthetase domain-containing protein n=1 Tax=Microbaculum marinum TaxID=1764581 RepID=A0AAW9RTJ0_9HYPH
MEQRTFRAYVKGACASDGNKVFSLDGTAFFKDRFVSKFHGVDGGLLRELKETVRSDPEEPVGSFCLVSIDRDRSEFLVQFDPLGAYPCFVWRQGSAFAVSNNIHYINAIVTVAGGELTRTVLPYLGDFALGSAYDVGSPYEEIHIVGPGQTLGGGTKLEVLDRGLDPAGAENDVSYDDSLARAADRLRNRVEIVARTFEERDVFFDLTGGMDSRIVLAAVVSRVPRPRWDYRTLFDHPHPDGHCAALFGETYGLGRVQGIPWDHRRNMSAIERMRFETFVSMGVGPKYGWSITPPYADIAQLHGGYGEIAGSSPDAKRFLIQGEEPTYRSLPEQYLTRLGQMGLLRFFTPYGIEWLRGLLGSRLGEFEKAGVRPADAPLHYYNFGRLRSHFGVNSRLQSQNRNYVDLLYDVQLQHCALRVDRVARAKGKVNLDLIRLVGGDEVAGLPMAADQWDASLFASDDLRIALQKPPITAQTPRMFDNAPEKRQIPPANGSPVSFRARPDPRLAGYDASQVDMALRNTYRRWAFLETYLPETRAMPELNRRLDWEAIDGLLSQPLETLQRYPNNVLVQTLCDCVIWHQEMELSVFE